MSLTKVTTPMIQGAPFNIAAYGATGDGTTDDSNAIQTAITAATAAGGYLYVPTGTFIATNISLTCSVIGNGTLKLKAASTKPLLILSGSDFVIQGITLDGNRSGQTASITNDIAGKATIALLTNISTPADSPTYNTINSIRIQNCKFTNSLQVPYICFNPGFESNQVLNCTFSDCTETAIYLANNVYGTSGMLPDGNILISGCSFLRVGVALFESEERGDAVVIGQLNGVQIVNNFFKTIYRDALYFGNVTEMLIQGNTFDTVSWNAIQFQPDNLGTAGRSWSGGLIIDSNICRNVGFTNTGANTFVSITGSTVGYDFVYDSVAITNNTIVQQGGTSCIGIQILSHKYQNVLISGNSIREHNYAIQINTGSHDLGPENIVISNNLIANTINSSIFITGTDFVTGANRAVLTIKDNQVNNSGSIGIQSGANTFRQLFVSNNSIFGSTGEAIYLHKTTGEIDGGVINDNYATKQIYCDYTVPRQFGNWSTASSVSVSGLPFGYCRSGAGSPVGSVTPAFVGEDYLNTSGPTWYKSTGATSANWVALN